MQAAHEINPHIFQMRLAMFSSIEWPGEMSIGPIPFKPFRDLSRSLEPPFTV